MKCICNGTIVLHLESYLSELHTGPRTTQSNKGGKSILKKIIRKTNNRSEKLRITSVYSALRFLRSLTLYAVEQFLAR